MPVPSPRIARDPSAAVRLPDRQLYFGAVPLEMFTNPNISATCVRVFAFTFLVHEPFGARASRRTADWVARKAGYSDRTVRDCWDLLESEGFMVREREGTKWVSRITYELPPSLELDADDPVYRGSRRGDKTSTHPTPAAPLAAPPKPVPKSASKRIRSSGCNRIPGSGPGGGDRIQGSASDRNPGSGPPIERTLSSRNTTTTLDAAHRAQPSPVGSSSFLPFEEEGARPLEPAAPPEAPGSPQDDRREETDESPQGAATWPSWAVLAVRKIAAAWPDASEEERESWRKRIQRDWSGACDEKGRPASYGECGRVAALALEYAATKRSSMKNPGDPVGYLQPVLNTWFADGLDSDGVERKVAAHRPKPQKVAPAAKAAAVEPPPRPEGLDEIERELIPLMRATDPEGERRREELVAMADALVGACETPRRGVSPDRGGGSSLNGQPSMSR